MSAEVCVDLLWHSGLFSSLGYRVPKGCSHITNTYIVTPKVLAGYKNKMMTVQISLKRAFHWHLGS